ncbi:hypothetical protein Tco_0061106, partial [Tanacetum coccineum]
GVDGPPIMPEDPYACIMAAYQVPPSPDYNLALRYHHRLTTYLAPRSRSHLPHWTLFLSRYSPGYVPESDLEEEPEEDDEDPKEDPADYPTDRDDDDDDKDEDEDEDEEEEKEHPAPADSVPHVHRMTARIFIQDEPSISPLPIPSPPPNSPTHIEIPESCLPLRKRVRFASPTPSHEVRESSATGAAKKDRPAIARDDPYSIAREDLYGLVDS